MNVLKKLLRFNGQKICGVDGIIRYDFKRKDLLMMNGI